jgi:hypothetical protein
MIKNGKKPLSTKGTPEVMESYDDLFGNRLSISPELKAELDAKGLVGRWVDAKKLYEFNGYHPKGWAPYKRVTQVGEKLDKQDFRFGSDPDGTVRRGTMILAAKSKEEVARHQRFLKQKAERFQSTTGSHAETLRKTVKEGRANSVVIEGYDEDDE